MLNSVVVCTRNRLPDLRECLNSITRQSEYPSSVIVVDSSDGNDTENFVRDKAVDFPCPLVYFRTNPGLTFQRNFALANAGAFEVVHFMDDDVVLSSDYIRAMNKTFQEIPNLVGASGSIESPTPRPKPRVTSIFTLRDSRKPGIVLPSGFNVGAFEHPQNVAVDWLPGCSMSFRMEAIQGLAFDERRVGYAMGEDVDFGLKASQRGLLMHVSSAKLKHNLSPANRHAKPILVRMAAENRFRLAQDHPWKIKKNLVLYGTLGSIASSLYRFVRSRDLIWLKSALAETSALLSWLSGRWARGL